MGIACVWALLAMNTPPAEELLRKIQELEAGHAHLKEEMSKLMVSGPKSEHGHQRSHSISPQRSRFSSPGTSSWKKGSGSFDGTAAWKRAWRRSGILRRCRGRAEVVILQTLPPPAVARRLIDLLISSI